MYATGDLGNFANRLHHLPSSVANVDTFILEGNTYLNFITVNLSGKWEKEARKRKYGFTHDNSYLSTQQFSGSP